MCITMLPDGRMELLRPTAGAQLALPVRPLLPGTRGAADPGDDAKRTTRPGDASGSGRARGQRARRLGGAAGPQEREDQQAPAARRGVKAKGGGR